MKMELKPLFYSSLSVQFSSVTQWCPTLCNPMNYSMPDLPVHHQLPEFSHCWAYTLRKPELKETRAPQCSSKHCLYTQSLEGFGILASPSLSSRT